MVQSQVVVVVDAELAELRRTSWMLQRAGYVVEGSDSFAQAKALLASISPDIVVADVRLGAFNGLHLAALSAAQRPGTPFIVTHRVHDVVLEAEARRLGAIYVLKTATREELTRTVSAALESRPKGSEVVRRSHRKLAPVPTPAKVASSEAAVVDVSYGGVQLKLPCPTRPANDELPVHFDVTFPELGLSLHASRIWAAPQTPSGGWVCGADVSQNDVRELHRWRAFVDSINN